MGDELEAATEASYKLRDGFDFDMGESSRAAAALMKNMGVSAEEAYNLIAYGAQNGANKMVIYLILSMNIQLSMLH